MSTDHRQDAILRALRRDGEVHVAKVAEQWGVSQMTVRRDLAALEKAGALHRVHGGATLPRADQADPAAMRQETPNRPLRLGMLVPASAGYFHDVIEGARRAACLVGAGIDTVETGYRPSRDVAGLDELLSRRPDGLLLTPNPTSDTCRFPLSRLTELDVPAVFVERRPDPCLPLDHADHVATHHEAGVGRALRHLRALGHRRVVLITLATPSSPWISLGYRAALAALHLDEDVHEPRAPTGPLGRSAIDALLDSVLNTGATAVLAHPDEYAIALAERAAARGLAVPGDLSLIAYDDLVAGLAPVPLTAVRAPRVELGRAAAMLLLRRIREGNARPGTLTLLDPELQVRHTTGPPSGTVADEARRTDRGDAGGAQPPRLVRTL